jgi:hypothetical protein
MSKNKGRSIKFWMGPRALTFEGTILDETDTDYIVRVRSVPTMADADKVGAAWRVAKDKLEGVERVER